MTIFKKTCLQISLYIVIGNGIFLFPSVLIGHQPVMDMAPRWEKGYGIQTRVELVNKSTVFKGNKGANNPLSLKSQRSTIWIEGVYTFTREHRISLKMPYINQMLRQEVKELRIVQDGNNQSYQDLSDSGFGDLIVGLLNKWYINEPGYTGNLSFTPNFRLPTGKRNKELNFGHGVIDYGLSMSGSIEATQFYGLIDLFFWRHSEQENSKIPGMIYGFDLDLGYHPYHNTANNSGIFIMMGINGRYILQDIINGVSELNSGGGTIEMVPTWVGYKDNIMIRIQVHTPIYTHLNGTQLGTTSGFQAGIGIVY